jgi:CHAT domain-containing protein
MGKFDKVESLLKRPLLDPTHLLEMDHPEMESRLKSLALIHAALGHFGEAYQYFRKAQIFDNRLIDQVMGCSSWDRCFRFFIEKNIWLNLFFSLVSQHLSMDSVIRKDTLDLWLRRKGIILETQKPFQNLINHSDDPIVLKTFQDLNRVSAQLEKLTFVIPDHKSFNAYRNRIDALDQQKTAIEASLIGLSREFVRQQQMAAADCEKVAHAMSENTALVEFARIRMFDFNTRSLMPAHYLAFILHAGESHRVELIDLGRAEKIDNAVMNFRRAMAELKDIKYAGTMLSAQALYAFVFNPIKKALGDVKEIFISPDGNLSLVPFEVIQGPDGRFLIEDYTFNYLSLGREILGFGQVKKKGAKSLFMGDPAFDMALNEKTSVLRNSEVTVTREITDRFSTDMMGLHFGRLPGTGEEVTAIQTLLGEEQAVLFTGKAATKDVLMRIISPRILHLATHGFFLPDLDLYPWIDFNIFHGVGEVSIESRAFEQLNIGNPFSRFGVALAGANTAPMFKDSGIRYGIVNGENILSIDLRDTGMVVLSACDTGLEEAQSGGGVFGLRRAFSRAGARSLVMSMWKMPDRETMELMLAFYEAIVSQNMDRCRALRCAALEQMQIVKKRYGFANPFYWGAFVFSGEP